MHMVIVSYVLTVAVMLPASGWLADKVGVRNIFFTAIVLFTRFTILRTFRHAERTVAGTRVTGRWRCDDGAGRQVDGDENRTARAIYGGDDLCHVTRSGRSAARSGARRPAGGVRVVALDLLINIPVGIIGAIATLMLMPNYTMQTRRFDLSGFYCWRLAWRY